jgi:uncharacterized membrane protein
MSDKRGKLNSVWLKASVLGSLWASSEIILGSFLHNLRVPFSSILLTGIAVMMLVSISLRWKEKGLIWRAVLICAVMKSVHGRLPVTVGLLRFNASFQKESRTRCFVCGQRSWIN